MEKSTVVEVFLGIGSRVLRLRSSGVLDYWSQEHSVTVDNEARRFK